jgi:hypothetical protein
VDDDVTSILYQDDSLVVTHKQDGAARTTTRRPAQASPGMRLEVDVAIGADGSSAGPMCGTTAGPTDYAFGAVNTGDEWMVGRMTDNVVSLVARGQLEGTDVTIDTPVRVAIECSMTDTGERLAMWVDGQLVADLSSEETHGPYDHVGVYADAATAGSAIRFDNATAFDAGPVPGLTTLGAGTEFFSDDFATDQGWFTTDDETTRIAVEDGALGITFKEGGNARWTGLRLAEASNVMRLDIDALLSADGGSAGPMCITTGETPDVAFGVVNTDGEWSVGRIILGSLRVIASGQLDGLDITTGTPVRMALECAVTDEGDRMAFWIDDQLVADVTSTEQHGPYEAVGAYADSLVSTTTRFDDAVVSIGDPAGPLATLGADTVWLEDSFDDPTAWSTGKVKQGRVEYGKGVLRIALRLPDASLWTWRSLEEAVPVVRAEGTLRPGDGTGEAGFLCGASDPAEPFYYGGLDTRGEAVVGISVDGVITELARAPLPAEVQPAAKHRVAVECAVTGPDADRVAVWVDGVLALDHLTTGSLFGFDRSAIYAIGGSRRFDVAFDDVVLSGGMAYRPSSTTPSTE